MPASAFFPVNIVDPGSDGVDGTADDGMLTVYNQDPSTTGKDQLLYTNSSLLNQNCHGLEFTVTKRYSHRRQMLSGYAQSGTAGPTTPGIRSACCAPGSIRARSRSSPTRPVTSGRRRSRPSTCPGPLPLPLAIVVLSVGAWAPSSTRSLWRSNRACPNVELGTALVAPQPTHSVRTLAPRSRVAVPCAIGS